MPTGNTLECVQGKTYGTLTHGGRKENRVFTIWVNGFEFEKWHENSAFVDWANSVRFDDKLKARVDKLAEILHCEPYWKVS